MTHYGKLRTVRNREEAGWKILSSPHGFSDLLGNSVRRLFLYSGMDFGQRDPKCERIHI